MTSARSVAAAYEGHAGLVAGGLDTENEGVAHGARLSPGETDAEQEPIEASGAAAFMTALIDARVPLALVTSAPIALMRVRMEDAGVPIPPVVVSAGDVERGKPDPDPYLKAAELLGVPISSCLVLEDAPPATPPPGAPAHRSSSWGDGVPRGRLAHPPHRGLHRDHLHHP